VSGTQHCASLKDLSAASMPCLRVHVGLILDHAQQTSDAVCCLLWGLPSSIPLQNMSYRDDATTAAISSSSIKFDTAEVLQDG
jgi:hypothetical protein